eukprot:1161409-Pelagomonas_calceolata.AAC.2
MHPHPRSSPKKILRIAASDSSSSDPGSDLSSMDGDNVWGGTNTAQLETLKQQQRELEKYQAKPPHLQSLLTVLPESQEPCVPGLSPTSPFNSYVVDMHNSSNDDSTRDARINPFAHSQPTTQPKLISGKSLRLALGLSVLLMVSLDPSLGLFHSRPSQGSFAAFCCCPCKACPQLLWAPQTLAKAYLQQIATALAGHVRAAHGEAGGEG